ncbi:organelle RRM domain-containing protein 6, chloroplastic-like [Magnolia sinica]|uniref:organelle RRM domain-containing protein 6, chloroplastic-like n=1 Tax=Magnolia sinica TaxID=86752 RepID=UPI002657B99D|nr:organelle RRM domain-containing protein 6, chloroplastic-like [Magnolia sinica]
MRGRSRSAIRKRDRAPSCCPSSIQHPCSHTPFKAATLISNSNFSLFVGNLPFDCSKEDLWNIFSRYGRLLDAFLPTFQGSLKPRGYAFVRFKYEQDAMAVKEILDERHIDGRVVSVRWAKVRNPKSQSRKLRTHQNHAVASDLGRSYTTAVSSPVPVQANLQVSSLEISSIADPRAVENCLRMLSLAFVGTALNPEV